MPRFAGSLLGLLLGVALALDAQRPYAIGPAPSWVKVRPPNVTAPSQATEGWEYVLVDRQEYAGSTGIERYWHIAYRVLDERAVKENSQLEIGFDSTYQDLILHSARVVRGDRVIDQLKPARIHIAQRETELEYQIFDGTLSVIVLLEDVRRGDVIEYSLTRRGSNPVFRGHFMAHFRAQDDVPIHQQYFRVVWPRPRPPHIRARRTDIQPAVTAGSSGREYEWSGRNIPALDVEKNLPGWFDPFPAIQVSDFASWREVAAWGDSLFPEGVLPAALRDVVARIRASSETPERRTMAALRFVQDEIRYMGVEIGTNSHMPYSPAVVMQRRYGDCKDKTLLLITMLRALGITARPALVSTTYRDHVSDFHPTAGVFDHAIVQVELGGREHWVDPSALYERGDLGDVAASYGAALVLGEGRDSLVAMVAPRRPEPLTDVVVSFDIGAVGEPTAMRVETRYIGRMANAIRSSMSGSSRKELQQSYVEYYAKLYPSIQSTEMPVIHDDEVENVVRLSERYTIPEFWVGDSAEGHVAKFEPLELSNAMPSASTTERRMPLAVSPAHIRYTINARLKEGWAIKPEQTRIATTAARFSYAAKVKDEVLTLSYEYETLADHVMPAAAKSHIKDMARAWDILLYRITPPGNANEIGGGTGSLNWPVVFAGLFAAVITAFAAIRLSRAQLGPAFATGGSGGAMPAGVLASPGRLEPVGLGGWLILVGLGVTLTPIRVLITMTQTFPSYGAATWSSLTTPGAANYHPAWAPILMFELIGNIAILTFSILLVWLFYARKRQFPVVFSWVVPLSWLFVAVDSALVHLVPVADTEPPSWPRHVSGLLVSLIWVAYMRRSRRVRNTFVN